MSTYYKEMKHQLESQRLELMRLKDSAEVPGVADILSSDIKKVESKLRSLEADGIKYRNIGLNHWYWDQDDKNVLIMLLLSHVDSEKMEKNIMSDSVDIKFHDVEGEGKHLRFVCQKLLKEIVPGGSRVEVQEHSVKITLPKCTEDEHWSVLVIKKDKNSVGTSKRRNME